MRGSSEFGAWAAYKVLQRSVRSVRRFAPATLFAQTAGNTTENLRADRRYTRQMKLIMQKRPVIRSMRGLAIIATTTVVAGCANNQPVGSAAQYPGAERDYEMLTGTWELTRGVDNGMAVPQSVARNTILITDRNTFRFPKASGIGTHPAGRFTVNPTTRPKQVDTIAEGGRNAGQLTRGIYEIIDATHKRACWGRPGGARPTAFTSPRGSGRILQYWKKIGRAPPR